MRQHRIILGVTTYLAIAALLAIVVVAISARPTVVVAQATDSSQTTDEKTNEEQTESTTAEIADTEVSTVTYDYVAQECDAQTYFVRKSLLLFDKANDDVNMSHEAIVYAETNIVQQSNPHLLAIGEEVSVDANLVEKYARSSANLTEQEIAAWSVYTGNVDFELDTVKPVNNTEQATTPQDVREEAAQEAAAQAEKEAAEAAEAEAAAAAAAEEDSNTNPIWWVVGGGAVVGLWYTLWRRNEEE